MSLMRRSYCLATVLFLIIGSSEAQLFTDQGLLSGSGLTVLPTATIAPSMEWRLQYSRVNYLKSSTTGMNIATLSAGLSSTLEAYLRFTGEQSGTFSSQLAHGFGGKFRFPGLVPVVRRLAIWADVTSTDQAISSALFPSDAFRTAVTATFDSNGVHPTALIGVARIGDVSHVLFGGGVTIATGNSSQVGFEFVHGYMGKNSDQLVASGSMRVFPNVSFHASPGYLSTSTVSTWTISFGISCSTSDIDFHPVLEEKRENDFILPTIEEIEKESQGKPSGDGTMLDGPKQEGIQHDKARDTAISLEGSPNKSASQQELPEIKPPMKQPLQEKQKPDWKNNE